MYKESLFQVHLDCENIHTREIFSDKSLAFNKRETIIFHEEAENSGGLERMWNFSATSTFLIKINVSKVHEVEVADFP